MFELMVILLGACVLLTLWLEHQRTGGITLISLLTLGNIIYVGLTPIIAYYWPEGTLIFNSYISDADMDIEEANLLKVVIMCVIFQFATLVVAIEGEKFVLNNNTSGDKDKTSAAIFVGWIMVFFGLIGIVWLGIVYNGNPWGLYQISYVERSPLFRTHNSQAFLMLLGIYGASQLMVVFIKAKQTKLATLVLFIVILHGIGIKSKSPIFFIFMIFFLAVIDQGINLKKFILPMGASILMLMTMSVLRGVGQLSTVPTYIYEHWDEIDFNAIRFWENDIPGPASITYFLINNSIDHFSLDPLLEVIKVIIPNFIFDRGPLIPDIWAEKMLGDSYQLGLGFGWSVICDGYIVAGWLGVLLVGYFLARIAQYIDVLKLKNRESVLCMIVWCTSAPIFFMAFRESIAGIMKGILVLSVVLWLPTLLLGAKRNSIKFN